MRNRKNCNSNNMQNQWSHILAICLTDWLINKSASPTYVYTPLPPPPPPPPHTHTHSVMTAITNILGFPFEQGPSTLQVYKCIRRLHQQKLSIIILHTATQYNRVTTSTRTAPQPKPSSLNQCGTTNRARILKLIMGFCVYPREALGGEVGTRGELITEG